MTEHAERLRMWAERQHNPNLQTILDQPQHHLLEPHTTTAPAARPNHG